MNITYIHHSSFLVETDSCYYLFDYENGRLPQMDVTKPIFVLASHGHHDHYNPKVFSKLKELGMEEVYGVLSEDISLPKGADFEMSEAMAFGVSEVKDSRGPEAKDEGLQKIKILQVSPRKEYQLWFGQKLTPFKSTDEGVAFLIEDGSKLIYHAGDLNDWVWEGESYAYNKQMTIDYHKQIKLLTEKLNHREIDVAFVVLDPRQEKDYDRGLCYFLEHIPVKKVYPMHYWGEPDIIETFLREHPEYKEQVEKTE